MKYILDFDHTLYETSRFVREALPEHKESGLSVTPAIWDIMQSASFLYSDTLDFLRKVGKENVSILTAMTPALGPEAREFQKIKLAKSGVTELVSEIVFMEGDKGPYIVKMCPSEPTLFLDDTLSHLTSAKKMCPEIHVVQMVRKGLEHRGPISTDPAIPVVTNLEELLTLVHEKYER